MSNSHVRERKSLRQFIDERGLRYQWVAERLGVTPSHLSRLMDGERSISPGLASRLAELFDVPASTFLPEQPNA